MNWKGNREQCLRNSGVAMTQVTMRLSNLYFYFHLLSRVDHLIDYVASIPPCTDVQQEVNI